MYFEIADKEYNGYEYQQVTKKDFIDVIEAVCRFSELRWFVLDMYDTTNIISKLAYICQHNGIYSFNFDEIEPFTEMNEEYLPLLVELLKEHPYVGHITESDNRYTIEIKYSYIKECKDEKLVHLSNEEVTRIINKHNEAMKDGEEFRADFSNCLIENFDFSNYDIREMNFNGATLRFCSFVSSEIRKIDFRNATFYRCKLTESNIGNCSFNEAAFYNCEMSSSDYICCNFSKASFYFSPCFGSKFMDCKLSEIAEDYSYIDNNNILFIFDSSKFKDLSPFIGIGDDEDC